MGAGGIGTFQALAVVVLALMPGAAYTWAYERQVGISRAGITDRVLRLVATSCVFLAFASPALYELYRRVVVTGQLQRAAPLPAWVWPLVALIAAVPVVLGHLLGGASRRGVRWVRWLAGPAPAP